VRLWFVGQVFALILLIAIGVSGVVSSPPPTGPQPNSATGQGQVPQHPKHEQPSPFSTIGAWARNNRETIDPLVGIGALLAAVILASVTGGLWTATRKLATSTEDLAIGAQDQVAEMRLARALAEKEFDLSEKQILLADRQCELAEKQHGLQREQYLAEHRPRIKIRSIAIARPAAGDLFQSDRRVRGSLVIVNVGAASTHIREAEYRFFWGRSLPMAPPLGEGQAKPLFGVQELPYEMAGHESCLLPIESDDLIGPQARAIMTGGGVYLYVMGAVKFSDWNLNERWMGFCQQYIPAPLVAGEGHFVPVENPDYEYED
jgi:hypothetical protein